MKKLTTIPALILLMLAGCGEKRPSAEGLVTVDVTADYPKKELILQDFMDVEYIPLETTDEFVTMAWAHAIGQKYIIVRNRNRATDGKIFIFDRNGKGLRVINRLGSANEEYTFLLGITLDEENEELFVNDHWRRKILVYDMLGNFKRILNHKEDYRYDMEIYNFDRDHLICHNMVFDEGTPGGRNEFLIISKQDGSVAKEIEIPFEKKISSDVRMVNGPYVMPIRNRVLVPQGGNSWTLMETSSDKVYQLKADYSMQPVIERTPTIQTMTPGVFLYPAVLTDRYCFMQTVKAEWDWGTNSGHKRTNLVYDKQENKIYEYEMHNADMTKKQSVIMTSEVTIGNNEIALVHKLEAPDLVEAHEKGQLKGPLKEVAATLDEESNPVLMVVKYRK